ncbi:GxxExxY protein [Candidatus Dependentiae bacterium]|nr:GxxExxY protein [Candidatus Dependentiae bacterium]
MEFDTLSNEIIGCAIEVHKTLGPGLLEKTYLKCLEYELKKIGHKVETEKELPVKYKDIVIDFGYRMDIVVNNEIIVELKSVKEMSQIYEAQILTYMKLSEIKVGLLINFNVLKLKDGLRRFVLKF